ncbi:hypothetical protein Nham_4606 (plasmid) [Nitrobacter hamburgensis X14]|uniref:Uncharacterized protein n=1 Tax=Nitrobacter hamburgensis (strain DSM 10229 / NCIMB 13809 / X14) TaxID=323097 RepID=Q1QF25_NITHX|nr:hypothetical protein Nham_4606 [Nitrobacter hamburgensis X14]
MRLHRPARSSTVDGALNPVVTLIRPRQIDSHPDHGAPQQAIAYGVDARCTPTIRNQTWQYCTADYDPSLRQHDELLRCIGALDDLNFLHSFLHKTSEGLAPAWRHQHLAPAAGIWSLLIDQSNKDSHCVPIKIVALQNPPILNGADGEHNLISTLIV